MLPVPGGVRGGTRGGAEAGWQVRQRVHWGGRAPAAGVGRVIFKGSTLGARKVASLWYSKGAKTEFTLTPCYLCYPCYPCYPCVIRWLGFGSVIAVPISSIMRER